jgi:RNA 2',3'-cyclic 3'-phosphodiesterase
MTMATTRHGGTGARSSHNLFFALWPDDALRERIASAAAHLRETRTPRGRWIAARRYHLTVIFLGHHAALPEPLVAGALAAGDAVRVAPFDFALDVAGSFANRSIPWWLGCKSHVAGLFALRSALFDGMRAAGVQVWEDTAHVAHVTILRDADRGLPTTPIEPADWAVREFALIDSTLGAGASYEVLRRWPLEDSPAPASAR